MVEPHETPPTEFEITPEMADAGLSAILLYAVEGSYAEAASEVYRAMESVRRRAIGNC